MSNTPDILPLFAWKPRALVIPFPMCARIGKIRDTAAKVLDKTSAKHADYYRKQVTESLVAQFDRLGIPKREQAEQLEVFWGLVEQEVVRQSCEGPYSDGPGDAA